MYFVDSSGHSFYQPSFDYEPIGYEYYKNKYVFWIDNKDHSYCSINNYYIRPIYILSDKPAISLKINLTSGVFALLSSRNIKKKLINNTISIDEMEQKYELLFYRTWIENDNIDESEELNEVNDILQLPVVSSDNPEEDHYKYIYPFYVIANSSEIGCIMTNILISAQYESDDEDKYYNEYCYITVGGEFNEENEILYINGRNMGVNLPHEIIRAVYNGSYKNNEFDEVLYNEKLKEYLIEYMQIRGEIGNYNSAIQSLKWFGWGDKVSIVSLLETDNQFMNQFVRDYFDTDSDILDSFKHFINTTLLSLIVWDNAETNDFNEYHLDADFIGENQPVLENLFDKQIAVKYGGLGEETYYYKSYYDFVFTELLYKISILKYYYEHYFLPVHLTIHNASLHHKVYANDIKMLCGSSEHVTEPIIKLGIWKDPIIEFPLNNEIWFTEQVHYVDELYNEWKYDNINEYAKNKTVYYIHDTCANIPIKFLNYTVNENNNIIYNDEQVNVHIILEKLATGDNNILYLNTPINFYETDSIKVYDIAGHEIDLDNMSISYSIDGGRTYSTYFLGLKSLKEIVYTNSIRTIDVIYDNNIQKYKYIYNEETIYFNENEQILKIKDDNNELIKIIYIPSESDIHTDIFNGSAECDIIEYNMMLLRIKILYDKINGCIIVDTNGSETDITDNITIKYTPSSEICYESDFTFNARYNEYNDFVIYPKMFNNVFTDTAVNKYGKYNTDRNIDITYFINNEFRLRMLVNNIWHQYDFILRMPDIDIEFGKLVYRYYDDELKYTSHFNQLSDLTETSLKFNAFMHEPRLTRTNDINFMENFIKYLNMTTARYIDGNIIPVNEFCQYIDITLGDGKEIASQRVYIYNNDVGKNLVIPRKYFNYDVMFYLFNDSRLIYILAEIPDSNTYEVLLLNSGALIFEHPAYTDSEDPGVRPKPLYNDPNDYKQFIYNNDTNAYETETSAGIVSFPVKEALHTDMSSFMRQYIETHNITNKYKYLNQIHVFDLYRLNDHVGDNILYLQNNIDMMYHGIQFTHKSFLDGNHIHISGNNNNLILNSRVREPNTNNPDVDNKTFQSSLYNDDNDTIYNSYINTYDDLTIYSAYEGDWIRPTGETIQPSGYVYYEKIENGVPTGEFSSDSINIVQNKVLSYCKLGNVRTDYIDVHTFAELNEVFNTCYLINDEYSIDENNGKLLIDENDHNKLYIDKYNIISDKVYVQYSASIFKHVESTDEDTKINPTYSEYYNIIRHKFENGASEDDDITYRLRIKFYIIINSAVNNIQRIFTGDADYNNGIYSVFINNQRIKLTPFYSEYDQNEDRLFNTRILINQPGFDWVDIKDIDNVVEYITFNEENDYINYLSTTDFNTDNNDADIEHLLSYRKVLILNVTSRLINAIKNYETTQIFDDAVTAYKSGEEANKIVLTFKINTNQQQESTVNIKTVLRAKYIDNGEDHYDYFDDEFNITAKIIKSEDNSYNIDCRKKDEENGPYINNYFDNDNPEKYKQYSDFTVFFALIPDEINTNEDFEIDINPEICLVYKDYDMMEYPTDSFIKYNGQYLTYETDDFIDYTINDVNYRYGDCRESLAVIKLYNDFFNKKTVSYGDLYNFTAVDMIDELNINKNLVEYDMYLMHNTKNWYVVYISKDTCDKSLALYDYELSKNNMTFISETGNKYKLIKNISIKKFLINRYAYSSKNGKNHFDADDIIVGKVLNNERLPIDIFKSSKWELTPVSFDIDKNTHTSSSNIDMCIFDVPMYNNEYVKGYYDVTYRYSLDRLSTKQYKKYGTICIGL